MWGNEHDISREIVSMMVDKPTDGWQEQDGSFDSYDPDGSGKVE